MAIVSIRLKQSFILISKTVTIIHDNYCLTEVHSERIPLPSQLAINANSKIVLNVLIYEFGTNIPNDVNVLEVGLRHRRH